jgi:hypothetical protein
MHKAGDCQKKKEEQNNILTKNVGRTKVLSATRVFRPAMARSCMVYTKTDTAILQKRISERYDYPSTMDYVLDPSDAAEVHKAVTINISSTGLAALVFSPHAEGQKIFIKSNLR